MSSIIATNPDGGTRFQVTHVSSGSTVVTDPPAGHGGEGTSFAPTELVDVALATCTGATIAIKAKAMGLDPKGISVGVSHQMADAPRRIASIDMEISVAFPADDGQKQRLIAAARACPVHNSLSEKMVKKITFKWADGSVNVEG